MSLIDTRLHDFALAVKAKLAKKADITTPEQYGALGNGAHDDGPAIQAAFNDGNKTVRVPHYANYVVGTQVVLPPNGTLILERGAVISPGANIAMFDLSAQGATVQSDGAAGTIQGYGADYPTARGFLINAGPESYDQKIIRVNILDMGGPCVEFNGEDAGQRFSAEGGIWLRHNPDNPSIVKTGAIDTLAGNRSFTDVRAPGGRLMNLDGTANTGMVNCAFVSLSFGPNASRARIVADRTAILEGDLVIDGYDNNFTANVVAGNIVLAETSQRCIVSVNGLIAGGTITDLSNAVGQNMNYVYELNGQTFTPVWGQTAGTGPAIGNGVIAGYRFRNGRQVTDHISVLFGTTTTPGDSAGDWTFSAPAPDNRTARFEANGSARGIDVSANQNLYAPAHIAAGQSFITIPNPGSGTGWKEGAPQAWGPGDSFSLTITYEQG